MLDRKAGSAHCTIQSARRRMIDNAAKRTFCGHAKRLGTVGVVVRTAGPGHFADPVYG